MDAVSEVKSRLSVEDVVAQYIKLKRTGKNYKGLSPFTNEKTPSFVVSPEKQIWHDFSSGRGGDMFTFVEEVEGVDFKGALELLARKAGVDLDQYKTSPGKKGPDKQRLESALDLAAKFYQQQLKANNEALDYLIKKRAFKKETLLEFRLGYSPDVTGGLTNFLLGRGYAEAELLAAGLSVRRRVGLSDMFRGRIMIPLCDSFGKVVGFTARLLHDQPDAPKYINTPATALYDKSRHVFGLHQAKQAIRVKKYSVLVEGNMDVIASHQVGEKQVVATAGTALTMLQLKTLGRFSDDIRLAFDQDRAGIEATERALPLASQAGVSLRVVVLKDGKDPDELIRKDPKKWQSAISDSDYAMDWLFAHYQKQLDLKNIQDKRKFSDIIIGVLRGVSDPVEQNHYLRLMSEVLDVSEESLSKKLASNNIQKQTLLRSAKITQPKTTKEDAERVKIIDHLFSLALMMPGTRGYLELISPQMLMNDEQRAVQEFLVKNPSFDGRLAEAKELREITDYVKILSLQFEELYGAVDTLELQFEAARLRTRIIEYYVREQKKLLAKKLSSTDKNNQHALLKEVKELDTLMNRAKE